jgi:hypothetical protein
VKKVGKSFAYTLKSAAIKVKKGKKLKSTSLLSVVKIDTENLFIFSSQLSNFSKKQIGFVEEILQARKKSKSYISFSNKLTEINQRIIKTLPKEEQEPLLFLVSILYYSLEEINNLVREGVLPGNAEGGGVTLNSLSLLKSADTDGDPNNLSWWSNPSSLATVWSIAVAEPTPIGEAVAAVLTGIVGSYLVINRADCISKYVKCKQYTSNVNCSDCLHYCIVQGNWNCN